MKESYTNKEKLSFSLGACGIVYDILNKCYLLDKKLPVINAVENFRECICLYVALLFSGIDKESVVPDFYSRKRDIESMLALTKGKRPADENEYIKLYKSVIDNDVRDIRNCICHGLFNFVKVRDENGRTRDAFALTPNRSKNKGTSPIVIYTIDIGKFVEKQINAKLSVLYNSTEAEFRNANISKLALETARCYRSGKKLKFDEKYINLLDKFGMEFFSALIGSMLYVFNQNTLYQDLKDQEASKEVFFTLRNSLCHGNFEKKDLKITFEDPKGKADTYSLNVWEQLLSVCHFLNSSKDFWEGKKAKSSKKLTVTDFVEYIKSEKASKSQPSSATVEK